MMRCSAGVATDVGHLRVLNEDAFFAGEGVFLVTDGMGGHASGDVASRIAVDVLSGLHGGVSSDSAHPGSGLARIDALVQTAGHRIAEHGRQHPQSAGLGCTLAGICHVAPPPGVVSTQGEDVWAVFHMGDARVYEFADGVLRQLTRDHSEVQELVDAGVITEEQARAHPSRNVITRALGQVPAAPLAVESAAIRDGQRFLLCSDGLTTELTDATIASVLGNTSDPQAAATTLLQLALEAGGRDNVTVVVVDVEAEFGGAARRVTTIPRELIDRETAS